MMLARWLGYVVLATVLAIVALAPPSLAAASAEVVIHSEALVPAVLEIAVEDSVTFVNHSGRRVHVDFLGRRGEHHLVHVPGKIRASFRAAGRHPFVVHVENGRVVELRGAVVVIGEEPVRTEPRVCSGTRFEDICVAP